MKDDELKRQNRRKYIREYKSERRKNDPEWRERERIAENLRRRRAYLSSPLVRERLARAQKARRQARPAEYALRKKIMKERYKSDPEQREKSRIWSKNRRERVKNDPEWAERERVKLNNYHRTKKRELKIRLAAAELALKELEIENQKLIEGVRRGTPKSRKNRR